MAELKERELKILSALSQLEEPARPTEIGQLVGENPLNTGRALAELGKGGLAVLTDKEQNLWAVTDKGKETLANLEGNPETAMLLQQATTAQQEPPTPTETTQTETPPPATPPTTPPEVTVPLQAETFKAEGQRLGVVQGKETLS